MKKLLIVVLLALLALSSSPAYAQVPEQGKKQGPPTLAYYDAQINVLLPRLAEFQGDYHNATGRYYQALRSHSEVPDVLSEPDHLSGKPTDQDEDLAYFWGRAHAALPAKIGWAFSINTYSGPDGDGYVLTANAEIDGETWTRSVNVGPEDWRSSDWTVVTEPVIP